MLFKQLANIDEGFWAWYFTLRDEHGADIASVNRAFRGLGREVILLLVRCLRGTYSNQQLLA